MELEFTQPERLTADFVGEPGDRTFYLQAQDGEEEVSILVEKQQVAGIAELLERLLAGVDAAPYDVWDIPAMRLHEPVTPRWRGGQISVGLDPQLGHFVLEVTEFVPEDDPREPEVLRVWLSEDQAKLLAAHAAWAVEQGRPSCQLCGLPKDPEGHTCPRTNGDARHL